MGIDELLKARWIGPYKVEKYGITTYVGPYRVETYGSTTYVGPYRVEW